MNVDELVPLIREPSNAVDCAAASMGAAALVLLVFFAEPLQEATPQGEQLSADLLLVFRLEAILRHAGGSTAGSRRVVADHVAPEGCAGRSRDELGILAVLDFGRAFGPRRSH